MRRTTVSVVALLVVVGTALAVPAAALTSGDGPLGAIDAGHTAENGTDNASVEPGAQLTGIVGVQQAEIEGEVESRSFGIAFKNASGNASKAGVVAEQVGDLQERLDELKERKQELREARENGSLSEGQYRAKISEVAARTATVRRLANQTGSAAQGLPAEALEAKGVNATAIQTLKRDAKNLTGPEVAEIARSIAGPGAGRGLGANPAGQGNNSPPGLGNGDGPGNAGPPGNDTGAPGNDAGDPNDDTGAPGTNETQANNGSGQPGNGSQGASNDSRADSSESRATIDDRIAAARDAGAVPLFA